MGGAYQVNSNLVLRGGFGITYLPSNSGYFASPVDYGTSPFSSGTMQTPYGASPNGVPVIHMYDSAFLNIAPGGDPGAAPVYGTSEAKFDRHFKNGRAIQYNLFIERRFAGPWMASVGFSSARSDNLFNRNFAIQNNQLLPTDLLNTWKASYIASNLTLNPASVLIANPFQPTDGSVRNFTGSLGAATIARQSTYNPYPLLLGLGLNQSKAWARYNSLQARLTRAFANGFHMDLNYTWSKELDNSDTMEDNQYGNPGGTATGLDIKNLKNNMRFGGSDVTHRMSGVFLYDLPIGKGKLLDPSNKVLKSVLSGWQTGSTLSIQGGFPIFISGLLKYYSGAFSGRYITLPNGKYGYDQNWVGTVANNLNELRGPGRFNIDMSLRRNIKVREKMSLEISAEAANLLNNSQQSGSYAGALGNTAVTPNASIGLQPGMASSDTYGTIGTGTFPAREVVMNMRLRF